MTEFEYCLESCPRRAATKKGVQMKKPWLSKASAFHARAPFLLALFGAAFLLLFASTAYAQTRIDLLDAYIDRLSEGIRAFEACEEPGYGADHIVYDLLMLYEKEARRWASMARRWPLNLYFERSEAHARQGFELLEQYPCPSKPPGNPSGGGSPNGDNPGGGNNPNGDNPGGGGSPNGDNPGGGSSPNGDNPGSGCSTSNGPFELVALMLLCVYLRVPKPKPMLNT
jgi:hypothetical protein